jgi:hypothetical protein
MKIIGISAKMGCGKSTFTKHLLNLLGSKYVKLSFGDVLKEECSRRFVYPIEWNYSEEGKNKIIVLPDDNKLTVRALLQWYGTDICRAKDSDYWVKKVQTKIDSLKEVSILGVVIDDVRFPNEHKICDLTVRLESYKGYPQYPGYDHESETALDNINHWTWRTKPAFGDLKEEAAEFYKIMKIRSTI